MLIFYPINNKIRVSVDLVFRPLILVITPQMGGLTSFGRPYRSRTCDTLIKRYRSIVPPSAF